MKSDAPEEFGGRTGTDICHVKVLRDLTRSGSSELRYQCRIMRACYSVAMLRMVVFVAVLAGGAQAQALAALDAVLPAALLDNVEELVRAASAACELVPLELFSSRAGAEPARLDVIEFTSAGSRRLRAAAAARAVRGNGAVPLYVPGWWNSPWDEAARELVAALLQHHPAVLVLDTRRAFGRGYLAAAARVEAVARALYDLLEKLAAAGVPPGAVHVVGFSLGAHAAGAAGRLARRGLGAPPARLTALDPARPCFTRAARRLRRSDAAFVQVIHSSAGVLGLAEPVGHADVYVNTVQGRQPECARGAAGVECDHNAAWRVFAASVRGGGLRARRCAAWSELERGACAGEPALLGYACSSRARGMFLYKSEPPS